MGFLIVGAIKARYGGEKDGGGRRGEVTVFPLLLGGRERIFFGEFSMIPSRRGAEPVIYPKCGTIMGRWTKIRVSAW